MKELTMQNDYVITNDEREKLRQDICELLDDYDYTYNDDAIDSIIDEWVDQKRELILAFKKHPNYLDGKFMIAFDCDYERTIDKKAISKFATWLVTISKQYADSLPDCIKERTNGYTILPDDLALFFIEFDKHIKERTVSKELAELLEKIIPEIKPHTGEKTSRIINKLCTFLGLNKHPDYNREYAKFADALSPLAIKRHTILSVNPLDYLTMSFGNSWASCHTIDKNNKRNMPNNYSGCYSSGTISYMLDGSSMVFYTVDSKYDDNDYWTQPKINRQMFHWGEEKLVQGRLYPQDNDGNKDAYAPYRNIVQQVISTVFEFPNLWTLSRGTDAARQYIISRGTHYRDYEHFASCTLSRKQGCTNANSFVVGHAPICVECGTEHDNSENINCCCGRYICADCGSFIGSEDDVYWIGDESYCRDCVTYCEYCDEYEVNDNTTFIECENRYVCHNCLNNHYSYCERCHEYYRNEDVYYIECEDRDVCRDCLDDHYRICNDCEEYFPEDAMTWVESVREYVCNECLKEYYERCEECDDFFLTGDMYHDDDGKALCNDCYNDKYEENEEEC
jgi:hypothetical protein